MIISFKCTNRINKCSRLEDTLPIKKLKLKKRCKEKTGSVKLKRSKELKKNHKLKKQEKKAKSRPKDLKPKPEWIK